MVSLSLGNLVIADSTVDSVGFASGKEPYVSPCPMSMFGMPKTRAKDEACGVCPFSQYGCRLIDMFQKPRWTKVCDCRSRLICTGHRRERQLLCPRCPSFLGPAVSMVFLVERFCYPPKTMESTQTDELPKLPRPKIQGSTELDWTV